SKVISALRQARATELIGFLPLTLDKQTYQDMKREGWTRTEVNAAVDDLVADGRAVIDDELRVRRSDSEELVKPGFRSMTAISSRRGRRRRAVVSPAFERGRKWPA